MPAADPLPRPARLPPISWPAAPSREDQVLRLSDGRTLGYAEYGPPDGRPVLFFHSMPGSRLLGRALAAPAEELGLRVVAPDRPGIGLSDFKPGRTVADWPDDVVELADALGLDRFLVVATSGGGPFGLACGWKLADRVVALALVSTVGSVAVAADDEHLSPRIRRAFRLMRRAPWTVGAVSTLVASMIHRSPAGSLARMERSSPPPDRAVLADEPTRRLIAEAGREAFRSGPRGPAHDMRLHSLDWGIPLEEVTVPVELWQGELDTTVPVSTARWLAAVLPRCRAHFLPGEGHLWGVVNIDVVLRVLVGLG